MLILPSASNIFGNGFLSTQRNVRSSIAARSCWMALIIRPMGSRADQRLMLATDVACPHRLAVVKFEAGPQPERPGQAVRGNFLGLHHLPLWLQAWHPRRRACPIPAPTRCARYTACPRSDRNWRGPPEAQNAVCAPQHVARSPEWRARRCRQGARAGGGFQEARRSMVLALRASAGQF